MKRLLHRLYAMWQLMFRVGTASERFARFQAYRMSHKEIFVIGAQTANGGCFLYLRSRAGENMVVYVDGHVQPENGRVKLKYTRKPEERLITIYGRHEYRSHPTAYLRVI